MKKIKIIILLIVSGMNLNAQNDLANEMKYWKLRGRLTGDDNNKDVYNGFMTVGDQQGMSIPSEVRYPTSYLW